MTIDKTSNNLTVNGIVFDDFVNSNEGVWSQICDSCVKKYDLHECQLDQFGSGICGVQGCSNDSDHYIDFGMKDAEVNVV